MFGKEKKKSDKPEPKSVNPTKLNDKWRYHQVIHMLIKELNKSEEQVYKMNWISVLNWLSYFFEKSKVQNNGM